MRSTQATGPADSDGFAGTRDAKLPITPRLFNLRTTDRIAGDKLTTEAERLNRLLQTVTVPFRTETRPVKQQDMPLDPFPGQAEQIGQPVGRVRGGKDESRGSTLCAGAQFIQRSAEADGAVCFNERQGA